MCDVAEDFSSYFATGHDLIVLPISRLHVEWETYYFPNGMRVYPPGGLDLDSLGIHENQESGPSLAEAASASTCINSDSLNEETLIAFPYLLDWQSVAGVSHKDHLRLIRLLSHYVDSTFLDVARFKLCRLGLMDTLPGRAGTVAQNPMFAAAITYMPATKQARLIAGAAFSHSITMGLGLPLEAIDEASYPRPGETGRVAMHGLALYRNALEAYDNTTRFISAIALLEFLADPKEYQRFQDVKKVICRYFRTNQGQYDQLMEWFKTLTGRKEDATGEMIGYRTRIIHLGSQLEDCLDEQGIASVFRRLEAIISGVLQHMIEHSTLGWTDYVIERAKPGKCVLTL